MSKEDLKRRVCEAIRARRADIKAVAESVFAEPELGFKETKTSDKIKAEFEKLGLSCETGWGITGVRARMKGKKSKKTVALLGELDAIICRDHPHADPKTGAAHCCGHHVQLANMLAVGMAFKDAGIMDELDGDLMLFAVPAEEYVEIDFRNGLREKGDLRYLGGKQQLIAEGAFDGIDIAMQMHANITDDPHGFYDLGGSCNGFVGKLMTYRGRAAHAAGAPDKGINALNAAMMGVMGVNAIRERFREDDFVRFHPIINSGGDLVNVIPDYVTMEATRVQPMWMHCFATTPTSTVHCVRVPMPWGRPVNCRICRVTCRCVLTKICATCCATMPWRFSVKNTWPSAHTMPAVPKWATSRI